MTYSDETLTAFLNGQLSASEAHAIEAEMRVNPDLERQIMALDDFGDAIKDSMRALPSPKRLEKISNTLNLSNTPSRSWPIGQIGAIAAALMIGLFAGYNLLPQSTDQSDDWRIEVARYQALYVAETVANLETDSATLNAQFVRASEAVNLDLSPEGLTNLGDLTLGRAQILGYQSEPLVQIVFKTPLGIPIAFCIMKKENDRSHKGLREMQLAGLASGSWETDAHRMIVIGGQDQALISDLSTELQSRFN
ncbi:MAG: hypothetical protein AAF429_08790 [Pseudomonadota bacterium]